MERMTDPLAKTEHYYGAQKRAIEISENVARIRERVAEAAISAGRTPEEIALIAVTKTYDSETIKLSHNCGFAAYGENRVQELLKKQREDAYGTTPVHMIGALQKNKVNKVVGAVSLIGSVDSLELAKRISARAAILGISQDILLEVNIGGEKSKAGVRAEAALEISAEISEMVGIKLCGLMAIPPKPEKPEDNLKYFSKMYKLLVDIRGKKYDNISMDILSMGMSGDFEAAIACGSNMIRIGQAIFGQRNSPQTIISK